MIENKQDKAFRLLNEALDAVRDAKPNDRSVQDRAYAVIITDMEKVVSYYGYWIKGVAYMLKDLP